MQTLQVLTVDRIQLITVIDKIGRLWEFSREASVASSACASSFDLTLAKLHVECNIDVKVKVRMIGTEQEPGLAHCMEISINHCQRGFFYYRE
jgi:hypothetical protein